MWICNLGDKRIAGDVEVRERRERENRVQDNAQEKHLPKTTDGENEKS